MASFHSRPGGWQAQVRHRGRPAISRTFKTKADAEAWAHQIGNGSAGTAAYTHDALDNLTNLNMPATGPTHPMPARNQFYCYDAQWRLTSLRTADGCAGTALNTLTYDVQGNVASKDGVTYDFDFGNRLRSVSSGGTTQESYRYDANGRRVLEWNAQGLGNILSDYDSSGQLLVMNNARTTMRSEYIYLGGSLVAVRDTPTTGGASTIKYQHTDALGTPVAVTDANRNVIERSEYEPYGQLLNRPIKDGPGFTGHVQDAQTGLTYMQQRYFDPMIGAFLSVDPVTALSNPVGMFNRYDYAADNPYRFKDPDGRWMRDPRSRCNNPVFCNAVIPFRQVEPASCPICTNSGADRSAKSSNGPSAVYSMQSRHKTTGKPQESRLSIETEGVIAYGGGLRYTRDLKTKKDAAGIVVLGVGAKGAFGKGAVGPVQEASGQLSYRLWRIAEWNGGQDAPVDIDLGVSAGPLGAELQFDPGGSLDLNVQFNPFGEGGYAGLSVMFDDTLVPDE